MNDNIKISVMLRSSGISLHWPFAIRHAVTFYFIIFYRIDHLPSLSNSIYIIWWILRIHICVRVWVCVVRLHCISFAMKISMTQTVSGKASKPNHKTCLLLMVIGIKLCVWFDAIFRVLSLYVIMGIGQHTHRRTHTHTPAHASNYISHLEIVFVGTFTPIPYLDETFRVIFSQISIFRWTMLSPFCRWLCWKHGRE